MNCTLATIEVQCYMGRSVDRLNRLIDLNIRLERYKTAAELIVELVLKELEE